MCSVLVNKKDTLPLLNDYICSERLTDNDYRGLFRFIFKFILYRCINGLNYFFCFFFRSRSRFIYRFGFGAHFRLNDSSLLFLRPLCIEKMLNGRRLCICRFRFFIGACDRHNILARRRCRLLRIAVSRLFRLLRRTVFGR